ncbi:type IV toxin-antitoxin system AbiEi family antitoxin domain-containing protein [Algimonas porphyrae]|uniref:Transcriptional regulator n=1 Tax=Algimonas porphyrae TaxID=1128113 RepID=A0ABQ5V400_9PROT|nr:type IV toxin-antitoxin system AbiEi family antitoxin domain-containing protein [Algimonas porphyrae]GLQ21306.1 transcriptional regulator [Algimonas porphyrae]
MTETQTQTDKLIAFLMTHSMARSNELVRYGITPSTLSRAVSKGLVKRVSRGLYQLPDADIDASTSFVEVVKRIPKATICLVSALAYYEVTDQLPRKVWIAIGPKDRASRMSYPPLRFVRFREPYLSQDKTSVKISGVNVPIYTLEKCLADAFRNPKLVDKSVAIESLRNALESRKILPGTLAEVAKRNGAWKKLMPYLEALTFDG